MFVHTITVDEKNYERLKEFIAKLEETEAISHGFGHNNSRAYVIYATKDLSNLINPWDFRFTVRQV